MGNLGKEKRDRRKSESESERERKRDKEKDKERERGKEESDRRDRESLINEIEEGHNTAQHIIAMYGTTSCS